MTKKHHRATLVLSFLTGLLVHEGSWGMYDKAEDAALCLESSTLDLVHFKRGHRLPNAYRYVRRATRRELRDYLYMPVHCEARKGSYLRKSECLFQIRQQVINVFCAN